MLGQMLEVADPAEGAMFLGKLPVPARLVWRLAGRRRYARYIRRVRGGLHPALIRIGRRINRVAVALYRRSNGRVGGSAKGIPVLLITVPGRRTGTPHTVPIVYWEHDGGYLVTASSGGATAEPQWFRNIRATERARVRIADRDYDVRSRVAGDAERDRLWHDVVLARAPFFATYEQKAGRTIPIAVLTDPSSPPTTG
jgi:deazaflavin-dependent oxidoreductase (nitroreductase family)